MSLNQGMMSSTTDLWANLWRIAVAQSKDKRRTTPNARTMFAIYNFGNPVAIFHMRYQAVRWAEDECRECSGITENWREMYEVHKVRLTPILREGR